MSAENMETGLMIITGASSGIGESLAYRVAKRGVRLLLLGRDYEKLRQVQNQCAKLGVSPAILAGDGKGDSLFLGHPLQR